MTTNTTTHKESDASTIGGNASQEIKQLLGDPRRFWATFVKPGERTLNTFGKAISDRMKVTELSVNEKAEEPNKLEGRAHYQSVLEQPLASKYCGEPGRRD